MQVTSSIAPIDQVLEDALTERPGQSIRIRVQPAVYRREEGSAAAHYRAWRNLHWMIELTDLAEARAFREALATFFAVAAQQGIGAVHEKLHSLTVGT